jgi:hypothetical protein
MGQQLPAPALVIGADDLKPGLGERIDTMEAH